MCSSTAWIVAASFNRQVGWLSVQHANRQLCNDCPLTFTCCPLVLIAQVSAEDKKTVLEAVKEALEWVEENPEADADEFNDKRKEVGSCAFVYVHL